MNTPGYSRQRPVLQEADPIVQGQLAFGNGVTLTGIQSLRDSLLNVRLPMKCSSRRNPNPSSIP